MSAGAMHLNRRAILLASAGAALLAGGPISVLAAPLTLVGRAQSFDLGWRFRRGEGDGFEAPTLDDSAWRAVDLPHDWSVEDLPPVVSTSRTPQIVGPFDRKAVGNTATGFTVGGDGWYRKHFRLAAPAGARVELVFDGVYMNSDVWINGQHLGNHPFGYTPFAYDLTPYLATDGDNVVAVRVHNRGRNSRWYSGSGIYRHVWLDVVAQPARIARWGVGVVTRRVVDGRAQIEIETNLEAAGEGLSVRSRILDAKGRVLWTGEAPVQGQVRQTASIDAAKLWSPDTPHLYTLETQLLRGKTLLDRATTPFGVRVVTFDAVKGMTLNDVPIKLRGGCIHHDHGLLGAAAFDAAEHRKIALLKARGFNAVRAAHNPFSPAFLETCDRLGMMVICEAFDTWRAPKEAQDYALYFEDHWRSDITTMVTSARNHPSVILWSIGNEIPARNLPSGVEAQWFLANEVHRLDPTRPVTAAINEFAGRPVIPAAGSARPGREGQLDEPSAVFLDVMGYNYKLLVYEPDHAKYPQRVMYGSESFPIDIFKIWDLTERSPYLIGDFVWTALDYLGEAGLGGGSYAAPNVGSNALGVWPWVVSGCGDVDLIGKQKGASLARDVVWGLSPLEMAVQYPPPEGKVEVLRPWGWSDERESWTWPGQEGKPLRVRAYTTGDRVELRLNGRVLQSRAVAAGDLMHIEFEAVYAPGVLEAVAFKGQVELARRSLATTGPAAAVRLLPETKQGGAGRGDVTYVQIEIVDAQGRRVPDVKTALKLSLAGPADLAAFGSANPLAVGSLQASTAQTFDGRALAILRGAGRKGPVTVTVTVSGEGLKSASTTLKLV